MEDEKEHLSKFGKSGSTVFFFIQAISVPSEKLLRAAGHIISKWRSALSSDSADKLFFFLNQNMKIP